MTDWKDIRQKAAIYEDDQIRIRLAEDRDCDAYFRIMGLVTADTDSVWRVLKRKENCILYAVADYRTDEMIGSCHARLLPGNNCEFGYEIDKQFQGRGFGTKAMGALISTFRDTPYELIARTRTDNFVSRHIITKLGGVFAGEEPSAYEIMRDRDPEFAERHNDALSANRTALYVFDPGNLYEAIDALEDAVDILNDSSDDWE